jgi:hypothetical protein
LRNLYNFYAYSYRYQPMKDQELLPIKGIPRSYRVSLSDEEQIKRVRLGWHFWWYEALRANHEYKYCCEHEGRGPLAATYVDFGDVFNLEFDRWWIRHGQKIFTEKKPFKKVTVIKNPRDYSRVWTQRETLTLSIPLNITRKSVMRQIGREIKKAYENRVVDPVKESSAIRKIIKTKMKFSTADLLLQILKIREENPTFTLYQIGLKAKITPDLQARDTSGEIPTDAEERRRMTLEISRYLRQAKYLVENAGFGIFPSLKKPPTSPLKN